MLTGLTFCQRRQYDKQGLLISVNSFVQDLCKTILCFLRKDQDFFIFNKTDFYKNRKNTNKIRITCSIVMIRFFNCGFDMVGVTGSIPVAPTTFLMWLGFEEPEIFMLPIGSKK